MTADLNNEMQVFDSSRQCIMCVVLVLYRCSCGMMQNSHQLGCIAHHIHLCFRARVSDESQLGSTPQTVRYKM